MLKKPARTLCRFFCSVIKFITTLSNGLYLDRELLRFKYNRIRKKLSPISLSYAPELNSDLKFNDIFQETTKFLDFYTIYGLDKAFSYYGIKDYLNKIGLSKLLYEIKKEDFTHTLYVYNEKKHIQNMIAQIILTLNKKIEINNKKYKSLLIEWLNLQDYRKEFRKNQLPGQKHPGLGMGLICSELIIQIAKRLNIKYLINKPLYFHNAIIYSNFYHYKRPKDKALVDLILKNYDKNLSLAAISWLLENEIFIDTKNSKQILWKPGYMILPIEKDKELKDYFNSLKYKREYKSYINNTRIRIDREKFENKKTLFPKKIYKEIEDFLL